MSCASDLRSMAYGLPPKRPVVRADRSLQRRAPGIAGCGAVLDKATIALGAVSVQVERQLAGGGLEPATLGGDGRCADCPDRRAPDHRSGKHVAADDAQDLGVALTRCTHRQVSSQPQWKTRSHEPERRASQFGLDEPADESTGQFAMPSPISAHEATMPNTQTFIGIGDEVGAAIACPRLPDSHAERPVVQLPCVR